MSIAAGYGDLEIVKILLARGSNVNQPDRQALKRAREEWEKEIDLEVAAKMEDDDQEICTDTVWRGCVYPEQRRKGFYEEICRAKWGNTTVDNIMYLSRIHPTLADPFKYRVVSDLEPPIIAASRNGHDKIVTLLLENGAEADIISEEDETGNPKSFATLVAVHAGDLELLQIPLNHGAPVDGPLRPEKPYPDPRPYNPYPFSGIFKS